MANVQEIQKLKDVFEMGFIGIGEYEERMAALDPSFVASSAQQQQQQLDEPHDTYSSTFGYSDGGSGSVMGFGSTGSEYQSISYSGSHATDDSHNTHHHHFPMTSTTTTATITMLAILLLLLLPICMALRCTLHRCMISMSALRSRLLARSTTLGNYLVRRHLQSHA
jgi:hypothetical protein